MTTPLTRDRMRWWRHLVAGAALGVAAFTLVLIGTDVPGPGLDPDAMAYMGAAESLAWQGVYRTPAAPWWSADSSAALTHFPPGYPTALALPVRLGMAPPQAARLVEALAAALTVAIAVLLAAESAGLVAGVLVGVALLATPALVLVHLSVLSEPLFLACLALLLALMTRPRPRPLATGAVAAVSAMVRYAGIAFVGAAVLWAVGRRGPWRERLRRGARALLPALVLQGAWLLRTRQLHERAQIRHLALYGNLGGTLAQGATTIRDWLVPDPLAWTEPMPWRGALAAAALLVTAIVLLLGARRAATRLAGGEPRLLAAGGLLAGCYLGMLVASRLIADPHIPFDERILAPVMLVGTVLAGVCVASWWRMNHRMVTRVIVGIALLAWGVGGAETAIAQAGYATSWGSDFAGEQWRRSELLDWARTAGARHRLYTNWPPAVWFHLHRAAWYVPGADEGASLRAFADSVRAHDGRVLVFTSRDVDYMGADELARAPGLRVVETLDDGVVLEASR